MTSQSLREAMRQVGALSDEDLSIFFNATGDGNAYSFAPSHVRNWFKNSFADAVDDGILDVDFPRLETIYLSYDDEHAKELLAEFFRNVELSLIEYVQKHLLALTHAESYDSWLFIKSYLKLHTMRKTGLCTKLTSPYVKAYGRALGDLCTGLPETAGAKEANGMLEKLDTIEEIKQGYYGYNDQPPFEETIFWRCLAAYEGFEESGEPLLPILEFKRSEDESFLAMIDTTEYDEECGDATWLEIVREAYDKALKETAEPPAKKARQ